MILFNSFQIACVFLTLLALGITDPLFFRGRPWGKYGSLGRPPVGSRHSELLNTNGPSDQWMEQKLDHFTPSDTRVWRQRFFVNTSLFAGVGSPIFLQLGGEGTADPIWLIDGQIATNYGSKFGALLVLLEHRYYGQSHPTEDMSVKNLRYLTSEQGLADAAAFIEWFKSSNTEFSRSPVVVFGGSYSGSLSAWMRLKYPHLVTASVASSAPVQAIVNFQDYMAVVRDSLGPDCSASIRAATEQLSGLLEHPLGWRSISQRFKLCEPLNGTIVKDVSNLVSTLAGNFENVVQYNKDNREFEGGKGANITIDVICKQMTDTNLGTSLDRYQAVNDLILETYDQKCLDYKYDSFIDGLQKVDWNSSAGEGGRQWTYQTCVEFGFYQSSDLKNQPFGQYFPVGFFEDQCKDIFGEKYNLNLLQKAVRETNVNYGGFGLQASKVILPNGSIDPWHALGLTNYTFPGSRSVFIKGTAHCADLYPDSGDDPEELTMARTEIEKFIRSELERV